MDGYVNGGLEYGTFRTECFRQSQLASALVGLPLTINHLACRENAPACPMQFCCPAMRHGRSGAMVRNIPWPPELQHLHAVLVHGAPTPATRYVWRPESPKPYATPSQCTTFPSFTTPPTPRLPSLARLPLPPRFHYENPYRNRAPPRRFRHEKRYQNRAPPHTPCPITSQVATMENTV